MSKQVICGRCGKVLDADFDVIPHPKYYCDKYIRARAMEMLIGAIGESHKSKETNPKSRTKEMRVFKDNDAWCFEITRALAPEIDDIYESLIQG